MIKNILEQNQHSKPNSELLQTLQAALPQYFDKEGNFQADKFASELKENNITEIKDGYRLNFVGKDYARLQTAQASETVIVPDHDHNTQPEHANSENVFITGDNLEALRHLQNAYTRKVKMIYIDPPYNTGKEFVYHDKFELDDEKLKHTLGYSDAEIERLKSIQGKSSHSAWLTFMYPRLKLAHKLLTDDGVIFVSIDDNEQANLKLLMDDIFGEGNFVADFIVIRSEGGGLAKQAIIGHDYLLVYAKNILKFTPLGKPKDIRGKIVKIDDEDYWIETDWLREEFGRYGTCFYEDIIKWHGQDKKNDIDKGLEKGIYTLIKKDSGHIVGRYRKISEDTSKFYTILKHLNKKGNDDLQSLELKELFDFPKPVDLLKEIVLGATIKDKNVIILDFFAGSGTTAHAVMQLNAEDDGNRKYIMVQWDEPTNPDSEARKAGYNSIDEISRERIKRAATKIKAETEKPLDLGFKHYRLVQPEIKTLNKIIEFNPNEHLFDMDMVAPFAYQATHTSGLDTILQTWLIQDGYPFNAVVDKISLANYQAHYVKQGAVLYLIEQGFHHQALKDLLNKIGNHELTINTIIIYPYSFTFEERRALDNNIRNNLDNSPTIIERY